MEPANMLEVFKRLAKKYSEKQVPLQLEEKVPVELCQQK